MIIFIRGLPGSGKTTIADKLGEKLHWPVVHVDLFKKEYMTQHPEADFLQEVVPASYTQTLKVLEESKSKHLIVEEVFRNKVFVQQVLDFCTQNHIANSWFKIIRDRTILLEVNDERTRKVKNTPEILDQMQQQINDISLKNEFEISNINIGESVQEIFPSLQLAMSLLDKTVEVTIDRPIGSKHPMHGFVYKVNYGYVEGIKAPDGEDLDAYYLGANTALTKATGVCIAIVHRDDDDDDKLVVVPVGKNMTDKEILAAVNFQEKWFKSSVIRK